LNNRLDTDMNIVKSVIVCLGASVVLAACSAGGNNQGTEYAPNMYHSVAYEPYSQITDPGAGRWLTSIEYADGHAEFFNSNTLNVSAMGVFMNMRTPPANTVPRNKNGWLPYRLPKDSLELASKRLKNPLDSTTQVLAQGKVLYETYCQHCHGAKGEGDGKVADKYAGVANLKGDAYKSITEGHIFHVITNGKGLMWAHGSQMSAEERWMIAKYVKVLQK
jgi:mono/diheme cytochrome c family protein